MIYSIPQPQDIEVNNEFYRPIATGDADCLLCAAKGNSALCKEFPPCCNRSFGDLEDVNVNYIKVVYTN